MMRKKGKIEQEWADRCKVMRTAIRLKHSLLADHEIAVALEEDRKLFWRATQTGRVPGPIDIKKVLGG